MLRYVLLSATLMSLFSQQAPSGARELFFAGAARPSAHPAARYSIEHFRDGKPTAVAKSHRFYDGDEFQFVLELNAPAYIYVLNRTLPGHPETLRKYTGAKGIALVRADDQKKEPKERFELVFPKGPSSEALRKAGKQVVPGNGKRLRFDDQPGIEKLVVLVSLRPLDVAKYFPLQAAGNAGAGNQAEIAELERNTMISEPASQREICLDGCAHYSAPRDPAKPFVVNVDVLHYPAKR